MLSVIVFTLICLSVSKQYWLGDFWEHSAVINELATNHLYPRHPLLSLDAPHPIYSPYALACTLFSRITHFSPIRTLSIGCIFNILLFLVGLYQFASDIHKLDAGLP